MSELQDSWYEVPLASVTIALLTQASVVAAEGDADVLLVDVESVEEEDDEDDTAPGKLPPGGYRTAPTVREGFWAVAKFSTLLLFFKKPAKAVSKMLVLRSNATGQYIHWPAPTPLVPPT